MYKYKAESKNKVKVHKVRIGNYISLDVCKETKVSIQHQKRVQNHVRCEKCFPYIIWSTRESTCGNGTASDFQFRALAQCMATHIVWIKFERHLGTSGILSKRRQCSYVKASFLYVILSNIENSSVQVGNNFLHFKYRSLKQGNLKNKHREDVEKSKLSTEVYSTSK